MDSQTKCKTEKLWPILSPHDRFPLTPGIWAFINIIMAILIALPFAFVAGVVAACLWLIDAARALLDTYFGGGMVLPMIATTLKLITILFAVHMERLMIASGVHYLVREARHALRECPYDV